MSWFTGRLESRNVLDGRVLVFREYRLIVVSGTVATPFMPMETPLSQATECAPMCETGRRGDPRLQMGRTDGQAALWAKLDGTSSECRCHRNWNRRR
ncbi:hypothetical protein QQF64_008955 [Cirrhinus molitorella]|uniref:Uncharacterized protein n=1 Tax=Cirrhinus molitorella TaxID=172907 RepID=A0ABR3M7L4_9TELE